MTADHAQSLYAIDLNERQTLRTLEQAIRHQAEVEVLPRIWTEELPILCRLAPPGIHAVLESQRQLLLIPEKPDPIGVPPPLTDDGTPETDAGPAVPSAPTPEDLIGVYCDVGLNLGEQRYLFSSNVTAIDRKVSDPTGWRIRIARPESIQVAQRRRYWRFHTARSTRVQLDWVQDDKSHGSGIGWLCNVSVDGLACRVDSTIADRLWIGTHMTVRLTLEPNDPQLLILDGVLCNKTPAGSENKHILGVQFLSGDEHEVSTRSAAVLREQLLARCADPKFAREGADR